MEQEYQDVRLTFKQWVAFREAAKSSQMIKSPHDLDVAVNHFLRLWYAVRNEWVEQEKLDALFSPDFDGKWTIPAADDVPLTADGRLADPEMLSAWKDYCGVA
jgi:hypothetical protein